MRNSYMIAVVFGLFGLVGCGNYVDKTSPVSEVSQADTSSCNGSTPDTCTEANYGDAWCC